MQGRAARCCASKYPRSMTSALRDVTRAVYHVNGGDRLPSAVMSRMTCAAISRVNRPGASSKSRLGRVHGGSQRMWRTGWMSRTALHRKASLQTSLWPSPSALSGGGTGATSTTG
jgi:hypothetical protein